jgi:HD superfamily phosphohydrolase
MVDASIIQAGLENALAPLLTEYLARIQRYGQAKILRDVIWGFNRYDPWEIALIDSPAFQRLRNIFQTSLALFTYPCAVHSRFEHSLGVASVASRMLNAIKDRTKRTDPVLELETRLAALLHDLGHGPFSHSSEKYYERLTNARKQPLFGRGGTLVAENPRLFAEASASEVLTYLLITTESFRQLWSCIVCTYKSQWPALQDVNLERAASMILGIDDRVGGDKRFYRQIINGPFDADKLDYLPRDGYFTGLAIVVDIERLLNVVTVVEKNGTSDLGVVVSGASVLEQVIIGKTQIFSSVYHHQKVRAAHKLLERLLQTMHKCNHKPSGRDLGDPVSYVFLDDYDLLQSSTGNVEIDSLVQRIKNRDLPKRALVIAYPCFEDGDIKSIENFARLDREDFSRIEQAVQDELKLAPGAVVFDLPELPKLMGTAQAVVEIAPTKTLLLQQIYPAAAWASAYAGYRKVAYVFTTARDRRAVGLRIREILSNQRYSVKLNDYSLVLAKC